MARRRLEVVKAPAKSELERLVDDYLAHVSARGLSRKTIEHYRSVLATVLLTWAADQGIASARQLDQRALDRLSTHLLTEGGRQRRELSPASVRSYLGTIGHFLAWARSEGEADEKARPQLPRLERQVLDVLSREEITRLEAAAESERDKLIVRTLADTGMRAGELAKLRLDDLVEEGRNRFLRIRGRSSGGGGKGNKGRLVPVQPALYMRIKRYATKTRPQDAGTDRLFLSQRASPRTGQREPLEVSGVGQLVRELGDRAGIGKRVHAHGLRHSFVTHMLRRGMNPIQLAAIVGHSDLTMINRTYAHLNQGDAAKALLAALREGDDED